MYQSDRSQSLLEVITWRQVQDLFYGVFHQAGNKVNMNTEILEVEGDFNRSAVTLPR